MCIYLKVTIEKKLMLSKLRFGTIKRLVTKSVFGELQLKQVSLNFTTFCCNSKIRGLGAKLCGFSIIYYFHFGRTYDVLESKSSCILLNKNINFNKNETKSKMENPTHSFKETNLVLQLIKESQIKSKTVISWSSQKKKEGIFCTSYFVQKNFFKTFVFYLNL